MNDAKTKPTRRSVKKYIAGVDNAQRQKDATELLQIMTDLTGKKAVLWGDSLVGFGQYQYQYVSGREGAWPVTAFSARKQNLVVYIMPGFKSYGALLKKLGKHKHSSSCLYINKLEDIKLSVLKQLIARSVRDMEARYEC